MAVWGVNGGPYLVLPLLGPSTLRDGIGSGVAAYADPVRVAISDANINVWYKRGYLAAYIVSARSDLTESGGDTFLQTSLDPYAAARSAYLQIRTAAIANQDDDRSRGTELPGGTPAANGAPSPTGNASGPLPQSGAPLPGDDTPAPPSAAPLPGDTSAGPKSSAPLPQSAAPLPGDDAPPPQGKPQS
jgi:phospholipid-binding lipoprotein MlaA